MSSLLLTVPRLFPIRIIWTLAAAIAPLPKSYPEQVIIVPLRSAVALSVNSMEFNGKDLKIVKVVKLSDIGACHCSHVAITYDCSCPCSMIARNCDTPFKYCFIVYGHR